MSMFLTPKSPSHHFRQQAAFFEEPVAQTGTWQQQFAGTWKKVERKGFYDFLVANGVVSFAAYLLKDADFGQVFTFDEHDDHRFQLKATGMPTITLPWCRIGKTAEDAEMVSDKDPNGSPFETKFWYDEKDRMLRTLTINPKTGVMSVQSREINEQGLMILTHTATFPDGRTVTHSVVLKKSV